MASESIADNRLDDECFGYYFHPPEGEPEWGSPQLDVNLRTNPTVKHYDPEYLRLQTVDRDNHIEHSKIYHPWPGRNKIQVTIGDVILRDRTEKTVEAFTFGGFLKIEQSDKCTNCSIGSPVPIVDLRDNNRNVQLLVEETIALIATHRAHWEHDLEEFEARVVKTSVESLYFAILKDLETKFQKIPKTENTEAQDFLNFLHHQVEHAKSLLDTTSAPTSLNEIF
ncbi:MAG: hypothetical protein PVI81_07440 [Anaerolineales bacterium]|jgi:hypothetical protein